LFTISNTCWLNYVEQLGVATRFVDRSSIPLKAAETEARLESGLVSDGVTNHLAPAGGTQAAMPQSLNSSPVPPVPSPDRPPATPGELRDLANAGLYTKGLARQASAALPGLLKSFESYQKECARQEFGSCLLMAGKEPPFILDCVFRGM
jgi:hypothetical protein